METTHKKIRRCLGGLHRKADLDHSILWSWLYWGRQWCGVW